MAIRMIVALKGRDYELAAGEIATCFDAGKQARLVNAKLAEWIDPLDGDGDGAAGGSDGSDQLLREQAGFALWRIGGGWYRIDGTVLEEPRKLQGRPAAEAEFDQLVSAEPA